MASGMARTSVIFMPGPAGGTRSASQVAEPVLGPARSHPGLVVRVGPHGGREALAAPLRAPRPLPRARGVDQHPVPESGAELRDVAILHGGARIDGRAEDAREDDDAPLA